MSKGLLYSMPWFLHLETGYNKACGPLGLWGSHWIRYEYTVISHSDGRACLHLIPRSRLHKGVARESLGRGKAVTL